MSTIAAQKAALRTKMKAVRKAAFEANQELDAADIAQDIADAFEDLNVVAFEGRPLAATYLSVGDEFPTIALNKALRAKGFDLCVPCHDDKTGDYFWARLEGPLTEGPHGIPQPANPKPVEPEEINLALVPGLAFDCMGNRLGHGAGIYDRLLQPLADETEALIMGLAFSDQLVEEIPEEDHDIAMCVVITEEGVFDPADMED